MLERLASMESEYEDIVGRLSDPGVFADQRADVLLSRRLKELEPIVKAYRELRSSLDDLDAAKAMLADSSGADRDFIKSQVEESEGLIEGLEVELRDLLLPR